VSPARECRAQRGARQLGASRLHRVLELGHAHKGVVQQPKLILKALHFPHRRSTPWYQGRHWFQQIAQTLAGDACGMNLGGIRHGSNLAERPLQDFRILLQALAGNTRESSGIIIVRLRGDFAQNTVQLRRRIAECRECPTAHLFVSLRTASFDAPFPPCSAWTFTRSQAHPTSSEPKQLNLGISRDVRCPRELLQIPA